ADEQDDQGGLEGDEDGQDGLVDLGAPQDQVRGEDREGDHDPAEVVALLGGSGDAREEDDVEAEAEPEGAVGREGRGPEDVPGAELPHASQRPDQAGEGESVAVPGASAIGPAGE